MRVDFVLGYRRTMSATTSYNRTNGMIMVKYTIPLF